MFQFLKLVVGVTLGLLFCAFRWFKGPRFFVVGDIHGHPETLRTLVESRLQVKAGDTILFLGDYIDRGPSSKGVIDYILSLKKRGVRIIALAGNHEVMFLDYLRKKENLKILNPSHRLERFLSLGEIFLDTSNGGSFTYNEYLESKSLIQGWEELDPDDTDPIVEKIVIPDDHLEFFNSLKLYHIEPEWMDGNGVLFVHAGLSGEALEQETVHKAVAFERRAYRKAVQEARRNNASCEGCRLFWQRAVHNPVCFGGLIVHGHWSRIRILNYYQECLDYWDLSTEERRWLEEFIREQEMSLLKPKAINNFLSIDTCIVAKNHSGHICAVEFRKGRPWRVVLQEDVDGFHS